MMGISLPELWKAARHVAVITTDIDSLTYMKRHHPESMEFKPPSTDTQYTHLGTTSASEQKQLIVHGSLKCNQKHTSHPHPE
jgi:hypothetical protein